MKVAPKINNEITRRIYEHEIMLSFNEDREAEMFYEWWEHGGFKSYEEYVDLNTEEDQ